MLINSICHTSFQGGNLFLEGLRTGSIKSMKSIRKIVSESNADVSIVKTKQQNNLESFDKYSVITSRPQNRQSNKIVGHFDISRNADPKELSVKLFNAVLSSIEKLNKQA